MGNQPLDQSLLPLSEHFKLRHIFHLLFRAPGQALPDGLHAQGAPKPTARSRRFEAPRRNQGLEVLWDFLGTLKNIPRKLSKYNKQ